MDDSYAIFAIVRLGDVRWLVDCNWSGRDPEGGQSRQLSIGPPTLIHKILSLQNM
jgi:hypothetical protein